MDMSGLPAIDCVSIFYEEGKGGEDYAKKNKFRCQIDGKEKSIVRMKNSVTEFAGLRETAKKLGLGDSVDIQLNKETKTNGRTERISIERDKQLALEMPTIINKTDKLLVFIHPVNISFSKNLPFKFKDRTKHSPDLHDLNARKIRYRTMKSDY